jgi:hypothetical protein
MQLSSARADITPPASAVMGGYGTAVPRLATRTHSPLSARCVVLWDTAPHVLVSVDVISLPRSVNEAVRAQLSVPVADLAIVVTHTHNGPALPDAPDPTVLSGVTDLASINAYAASLTSSLVSLVQAALAAPQTTVTLDYQITTQHFSANRAGLSYVETVVPVLAARAGDQIVAVLFGYGAHPVTAGRQTAWDGDYPAVAAAVIEAALPAAMALFVPGPMGDQDPVGTRGWALRNTLGTQLGSAVVACTANIGRTVGPITTSHAEVTLPLDIATTPANIAAVRATYVARESSPTPWYARHGALMVAQIDAGTYVTSIPLPLQLWRFAGSPNLQMAMTGGELVSGYAVYFRQRYGGTAGLWMGGYANEVPCYVCSNELLAPIKAGGSYEGGWDTDYPGVAGGSMTIYPHLGHFLAGSAGVENAMTVGLTTLLSAP